MNEKARTRVVGPEDPREGLEAVVALRRTLEALEAAQVENAFIAGGSWAEIAGGRGGGPGRERVHRGVVLGEDRGGPGGEQAGGPQEARQKAQGQVPGATAG